MATENQEQAARREALKQLREERHQTIAAASARMKEQKKEIAAIKAELQKGESTAPEIAVATGLSAASVMWYLATLKKYGEISESRQDGSYFRYRLADKPDAGKQEEPPRD